MKISSLEGGAPKPLGSFVSNHGRKHPKVYLCVNVASRCGKTSSNYKQLVQMDMDYAAKGLQILAFPCNQFAG